MKKIESIIKTQYKRVFNFLKNPKMRKWYIFVLVLLINNALLFALIPENKKSDKYVIGTDSKFDKNMFKIMLENPNGSYSASNDFPSSEYLYNEEKSGCIDSEGKFLEDSLLFDISARKISVRVSNTSYCYLYFDRVKETNLAQKLINDGAMWQSGLESDGYRFTGSGVATDATSPDNFICFGTTSKTECKNNEAKYMYRIIGVFEDESGNNSVKLIKYKQLGAKTWHSSNSDASWENSDVYNALNGSDFLTNVNYDYMQNNIWKNKIANWRWSALTNKVYTDSGLNYYNTTNTQQIYLHELNRINKTSNIGEWTTPLAKIGLMYVSDYMMSLGSSALTYTSVTNQDILKTGWMHQNNNDINASIHEWTMSRVGYYTKYEMWTAWTLYNDGHIGGGSVVTTAYGVRPTFYLTPSVVYGSGTGDYADPIIIEENSRINVTNNNANITATISQGEHEMHKYCINSSATDLNNCEWKNASSTIHDTLLGYGNYYLHVYDKGGYLMHSDKISYLNILSQKLINDGAMWQSGLEGDGYRFTGSGAATDATSPDNFICFGTTSKTECKNNEEKYMYRIIGIFKDINGNDSLKLIKYKQLRSVYAWHSDRTIDVSWENSDLYKGLNGSYFLTNTSYNYLQNSTWLNKIAYWKWSAVNTKTYSNSGVDYYNGLNTREMYLHEMNRTTKTSNIGTWTTPVAKMGLMYASDYGMSLGSGSLNFKSSVDKLTLKTGWMYQLNNDTSTSSVEWTLSRIGLNGSYWYAWIVYNDASVNVSYVTVNRGVRPVFYLAPEVSYNSGTGDYTDPFIIS